MAIGPICRILLAAFAVLSPMTADAAFGFARGTTGGGNTAAIRPTTIAQLKTLLCDRYSGGRCVDDTPRVIELDRTFDFRGTMGTTTAWGCYTNNCGANTAEFGIDNLSYCNGKTSVRITYDNAGPTAQLIIGSNKTLRGIGTRGTIVGSGIRMVNSQNVIIQNIAIVDINAGYVWGGDGIRLEGVNRVWIDHNYFARIGRQMLSTGSSASTHVTISDNHFDGRSSRSAYCDGNHYWNILFTGVGETITFSGNFLHNMSGRAPQFGGGTYHVVNNLIRDVTRLGAIMTSSSAGNILIEGNYFERVITPINTGSGRIFAPFWDASDCQSVLGRRCVSNDQHGSGTAFRPVDTAALATFSRFTQFVITPFAANHVIAFVTNNSGTGRI